MNWIETTDEMPPKNQIVWMWNFERRSPTVGKWNGKKWSETGAYTPKNAAISHWSHITPPTGVPAAKILTSGAFYTSADSQDNGNLK